MTDELVLNGNSTDRRGWEIESRYRKHWADDVNYDLAEDIVEPTRLWVVITALVCLVTGIYLWHGMEIWLSPPVVVFRPPPLANHLVINGTGTVTLYGDVTGGSSNAPDITIDGNCTMGSVGSSSMQGCAGLKREPK